MPYIWTSFIGAFLNDRTYQLKVGIYAGIAAGILCCFLSMYIGLKFCSKWKPKPRVMAQDHEFYKEKSNWLKRANDELEKSLQTFIQSGKPCKPGAILFPPSEGAKLEPTAEDLAKLSALKGDLPVKEQEDDGELTNRLQDIENEEGSTIIQPLAESTS